LGKGGGAAWPEKESKGKRKRPRKLNGKEEQEFPREAYNHKVVFFKRGEKKIVKGRSPKGPEDATLQKENPHKKRATNRGEKRDGRMAAEVEEKK